MTRLGSPEFKRRVDEALANEAAAEAALQAVREAHKSEALVRAEEKLRQLEARKAQFEPVAQLAGELAIAASNVHLPANRRWVTGRCPSPDRPLFRNFQTGNLLLDGWAVSRKSYSYEEYDGESRMQVHATKELTLTRAGKLVTNFVLNRSVGRDDVEPQDVLIGHAHPEEYIKDWLGSDEFETFPLGGVFSRGEVEQSLYVFAGRHGLGGD